MMPMKENKVKKKKSLSENKPPSPPIVDEPGRSSRDVQGTKLS